MLAASMLVLAYAIFAGVGAAAAVAFVACVRGVD